MQIAKLGSSIKRPTRYRFYECCLDWIFPTENVFNIKLAVLDDIVLIKNSVIRHPREGVVGELGEYFNCGPPNTRLSASRIHTHETRYKRKGKRKPRVTQDDSLVGAMKDCRLRTAPHLSHKISLSIHSHRSCDPYSLRGSASLV